MASHHPQSPKPWQLLQTWKAVPRPWSPRNPAPVLGVGLCPPMPLGSSPEARLFPKRKRTRPALCLCEALCVYLLVAQLCLTYCDPRTANRQAPLSRGLGLRCSISSLTTPALHTIISPLYQVSLRSTLLAPCMLHRGT